MSLKNEFTDAVVGEMRRLYPERLADSAWDNVGLLLENTRDAEKPNVRQRVLLTNDLTTPVVDEAIKYDASVIIAYHPFIFRGLKSITLKDAQQASLIRLAQHNIAVYCPHTALDAAAGGINDWLASKVTEAAYNVAQVRARHTSVLQPVKDKEIDGDSAEATVGYGRICQFDDDGVPAADLIRGVAKLLGGMRHVLVVRPMTAAPPSKKVANVAVCAGSGADVFRNAKIPVHMYVTGEMSHHAALEAASRGIWVMCVLHSNSERLFLAQKLRHQLEEALSRGSLATLYPDATVLVSEADRDPFEIWDTTEDPPAEPVAIADRSRRYAV